MEIPSYLLAFLVSFSDFDHANPNDFSLMDRELLVNQLNNFIFDVISDTSFSELRDIGELAIKMIKSRRLTTYPLVYQLIELTLTLPIATSESFLR
ncbi:hypothetical protein OROGR_014862 [Orobanche gracilis]